MQKIANFLLFFLTKSFEKYSLNSLKLFTSGFIAPLKVPISYSKDFRISITITSFSLMKLSHFFGDKCFPMRAIVFFSIGTTSFLILTFGFLKGIVLDFDKLVTSKFFIFKVLKTKLENCLKKPGKPTMVPLMPSGDNIMVPVNE